MKKIKEYQLNYTDTCETKIFIDISISIVSFSVGRKYFVFYKHKKKSFIGRILIILIFMLIKIIIKIIILKQFFITIKIIIIFKFIKFWYSKFYWYNFIFILRDTNGKKSLEIIKLKEEIYSLLFF